MLNFSDSVTFSDWRFHESNIPTLRRIARKLGGIKLTVRNADRTGGAYRIVSGEITLHSWVASNDRLAELRRAYRDAIIAEGLHHASESDTRAPFGSGSIC